MRGGANKSFGIEVARLAGIPNDVTARAKEILKKLEKNDIARGVSKQNEAAAKEKSEIEDTLSELNLDNITPMQAFGILSDLVEKAKTEK